MTLLPRTAFGRTALYLALVLLLTQVAVFVFLRWLVVRPVTEHMASLLADQVALVDAALVGADPEGQAAILARLAGSQEVYLRTMDQPPPGGAPRLYYQDAFGQRLRERLGEGVGFRVQREGETILWVCPGPQAPYWLGMSARRIEAGVPGALATSLLVIVATSLLAAFALARYLTARLGRLAALAARVGRGELPSGFDQGGPKELRDLAGALEHMARDLRQGAQERALLLAGISHDLRTPLARLRLAVELLGDGEAEMREGMVEDIDDMDAIVGQFIASVREGSDEAPVTTDLNDLIAQVCARFARVGVAWETRLVPLPPLPLRPMAMTRLLSNLLENAGRYGRAPFEVSSERHGRTLRLCVLDAGDGLPAADLEGLFKPFARGHGGQGRGSGLGLVIARRIARLHGGDLTLHNRPGGGIEARVELPLS